MLQEAIDLQSNAVEQLVNLTEQKKELTFKAPTGSGKTYMMAKMMNSLLEKDEEIVFLVSALSKGNLAKQNFEKFNEYSSKGKFSKLNPHLISSEVSGEERLHVPLDYNVYVLPRDLYKKGGRLMQGGMENFLQNITLKKWLGGQEKKVYLIKDECHIATNNLDNLSVEYFEKIYNISATPKLSRGQQLDVEITNEDAVNAKLIKRVELIEDSTAKVSDAIEKFEEIKQEYRDTLGVNPCLIIQISNKERAEQELENIYSVLNKTEHQDLKWMTIVNNPSECDTNDRLKAGKIPVSKWKDYARENLSTIDIIIFKMVITEGWDIPRACMLFQVRDSKSKQLDEQVMGRVRRNPRLLDFENLSKEAQDLALTSWIWGVVPEESRKTFSVKLYSDNTIIRNEVKIQTTRLKPLELKKDFDLEMFLRNQPSVTSPSSIFDLYRGVSNKENSIKRLMESYSFSYTKWREFSENIEAISKEYNKFICDYEQSMELVTDEKGNDTTVSFPQESYFTKSDYFVNINDWVWKRSDSREKISFDSYAEKEWAEILKDLSKEDNQNYERVTKRVDVGELNPNSGQTNIFGELEPEFKYGEFKRLYMWGKNFLLNSEIKFEYYFSGVHSSYPDFVMKDSYDRIHIFEVKSVNVSSKMSIDNKGYEDKVNELKKAYKQASKLTNNIFYLPIQNGENWTIFQYLDGEEAILTKYQFEEFCKKQ
ncbi:DEAD/DEAH box helicase [Streptococcus pluranimalium]